MGFLGPYFVLALQNGHGNKYSGAFCKLIWALTGVAWLGSCLLSLIKSHTKNTSTSYQSYLSPITMVLPARRLGFGYMVSFLEL